MIAIVIAGLIAGGLNLAFRTALDADARLHRAVAASQEVRIVLKAVRADSEQAAFAPGSTRSWFIGTDDNDGERDTDSLRLVTRSRRVPLKDGARPGDWESQPHHADWSAVTWSLTPIGGSAEAGLFRREECPPGEDPYEEVGDEELISPTVVGLNFRYFDGTDWVDSWDTTAVETETAALTLLPTMVEVTVTFRPDPQTEEERTVTALFPVRVPPPVAAPEAELEVSGESNGGGSAPSGLAGAGAAGVRPGGGQP
jgi:hypothetical protein